MEKNAMTYDEYYELIKKETKKLKVKQDNIKRKNKVFSNCCMISNIKNEEVVFLGIEKLKDMFKTENGKNHLINILKYVLGSSFFEDMNEEQKLEYKKQGLLIKDDLHEVLGEVYGNSYGYSFKTPNSWEDMILFLKGCSDIYYNNLIHFKLKEPFYRILSAFNKLIETTYARSIAEEREVSFIINSFEKFLSAFEKNKKTNIDKSLYDLIRYALNKDERKFIILEDGNERQISFGDTFIMFCELYDKNIEEALNERVKNKEEVKINTQINKYYKRISKIPFNILENKNFPKYTNENYVKIIKGIIDKFSNDLNDDEKWLPYYVAVQMHYASYFKTKYYDEEKVFGKNKRIGEK